MKRTPITIAVALAVRPVELLAQDVSASCRRVASIPGEVDGRTVNVLVRMPVNFTLSR